MLSGNHQTWPPCGCRFAGDLAVSQVIWRCGWRVLIEGGGSRGPAGRCSPRQHAASAGTPSRRSKPSPPARTHPHRVLATPPPTGGPQVNAHQSRHIQREATVAVASQLIWLRPRGSRPSPRPQRPAKPPPTPPTAPRQAREKTRQARTEHRDETALDTLRTEHRRETEALQAALTAPRTALPE
jgi:hypothetical protein